MSILDDLIKPWELERDLKNEPNIIHRIDHVADAIGKLLDEMKTGKNQQKVVRLKENPFDREMVLRSLFGLYESLFNMAKHVIEK
ncbi:MAG: hypothetical protein HQ517_08910, partial [SAR324 cluster bacterium]|nr:hypothetical protein [SAR324 cluster bacterium]